MKKEHILTADEKAKWWGLGEWTYEPDFVEFEHNGISCKVRRIFANEGSYNFHIFGGYLCGYIKIPKGHAWIGASYDLDVEIHGGITHGEQENDGEYWIGFDCAHSGDLLPSSESLNKFSSLNSLCDMFFSPKSFTNRNNPVYRNIDYVIEECKKLADLCVEVKK